MAGVPEAVIAEIPEVLKKCKVCRTWERPQMKPMARTELSLDINKKVFADVIFYTMQDGIEILVQNGVSAIIQPSGSIRDKEIIKFANETDTVLVFSKTRHFRH